MGLNIKNEEVERLATELADLTGETKTEAIRRALEERRQRLGFRVVPKTREDVFATLEETVWSQVPRSVQGKKMSRREQERLLGYGKDGV
jgi:antitoxin VapB